MLQLPQFPCSPNPAEAERLLMTVQYRNEERSFLMPGSLIGVGMATPQKHSTDLTLPLHCCNIERGCTTLNGYLWIRVLVKQLPHNVVKSFPRCRSASAIHVGKRINLISCLRMFSINPPIRFSPHSFPYQVFNSGNYCIITIS